MARHAPPSTDRLQAWTALPMACISDALDALGLGGRAHGVGALVPIARRIVGFAVTVELAAGEAPGQSRHLAVEAIEAAGPGDILVIDNKGRVEMACFGGILATAAKLKGLAGVVADGASRDLDECRALDFPVFGRSAVLATARGRAFECATNGPVQCGGAEVRPGDLVIADEGGVLIVPAAGLDAVLAAARLLDAREQAMIGDLHGGMTIAQVDSKYRYQEMLATIGRGERAE